jgi:hypothetical protein
MSYKLARQVLSTQLNTYSLSKPIDVAWINFSYSPDPNTAYLAEAFIPATPDERFLSSGDRISGIYQVTIITPINQGVSELETLQDEVIALYRDKNLNDASLSYKVSIDNVYPSDIGQPNQKVITIEWQSWRQ